jgi:hypothetical protein
MVIQWMIERLISAWEKEGILQARALSHNFLFAKIPGLRGTEKKETAGDVVHTV